MQVSVTGSATCGECGSEGTVVPVYFETDGDNIRVTWQCTDCERTF